MRAGARCSRARGRMLAMATMLEDRFHNEMMGLYRRALKEAKYNATRFLAMVSEHGGLETARTLIQADGEAAGYVELFLKGRPDLTVEAFIFDHPEFHSLFTPDEHRIIRDRLVRFEYEPALK